MLKLGSGSLFTLSIAFALTAPACSSVEHAYDCNAICDRYKDCFDASYDASACASTCRDKADDAAYGDKAESCESCIDDRSCAGTFACAVECGGIVP
ncbi:hypothetical protein BH11MYX3_BH11MYX3_03210 [soil metagenome]